MKWQDTKEVTVHSNCHTNDVGIANHKLRDGSKVQIPCPEAILFYNEYMGGVDPADYVATFYDHDTKSAKWWKKLFYILLMTSVVIAWILSKDEKGGHSLSFLLLWLRASQIMEEKEHH
jgi:hypothetical protein